MSVGLYLFLPHVLATNFPPVVNSGENRKLFCWYGKHDTAEPNALTYLILNPPTPEFHFILCFIFLLTSLGFVVNVRQKDYKLCCDWLNWIFFLKHNRVLVLNAIRSVVLICLAWGTLILWKVYWCTASMLRTQIILQHIQKVYTCFH